MVGIEIGALLLVMFFLLRNVAASLRYREMAAASRKMMGSSDFVFDDTRISHKVFRVVCFILMVLVIAAMVYLNARRLLSVSMLFSGLTVTAAAALFAFVPYTGYRWAVVPDGIFIYNYNTVVLWTEMISVRLLGAGRKAYLLLDLRKRDDEVLKKTTYPLLADVSRIQTARSLIRDFINANTKMVHNEEEH